MLRKWMAERVRRCSRSKWTLRRAVRRLARPDLTLFCAVLTVWAQASAASTPADSTASAQCERLGALHLPQTHIVAAETVSGPTFMPPGARQALDALPAFCRVSAVIDPAVRFEVWLPLTDWNGKFQGTGNGGYNGVIVYGALAAGLRRHYATSSTDMGHVATTPDPGSWALGHPELVQDQGFRAQHETAVRAKLIIRAFYRHSPRRSYFVGCSSGGWQGITEALRYPREYDGIIAGAPAFEVVHLHAATLWTHMAATQIAPQKFRLVTDAVLEQCDANDGVRDGLLTDPRTCHFQPAQLACREGQQPDTCLTSEEITAFEHIYDGLHYASGEPIYPGWPRGVEYALIAMRGEFPAALAASTFKDMVFDDPSWDYHNIEYDLDVRQADGRIGKVMNNYSPDLRAFRRHGGKLILWHGWDDPLISPLHTLGYYQQLARYLSGKSTEAAAVAAISDFARLFMAPGVNHCGGGPGPDSFDALSALEAWVEQGKPPERIVAAHLTKGVTDRTRPLCPYPQLATYTGSGSTDSADSFTCRTPPT
ncbi:MAG TPA: tannase/feruloyl esterase family alpha/beta hydrolase [Steroidobacteraceae bacterium]|nr:tannase/feruloyl esterase family alpha/beta hydrolase [Steroidobacteraceae bacterium]